VINLLAVVFCADEFTGPDSESKDLYRENNYKNKNSQTNTNANGKAYNDNDAFNNVSTVPFWPWKVPNIGAYWPGPTASWIS